jgi:hypothetical protein
VSGRVIHVEIIEIETLDQSNKQNNKLLFHLKALNDDPILATLLKVLYPEEQLAAMNSQN